MGLKTINNMSTALLQSRPVLASGYDCSMLGWCRHPYTAPLYKPIDEVADACSKDSKCNTFEYNALKLANHVRSYGRLCSTSEGPDAAKHFDIGFRRCVPIKGFKDSNLIKGSIKGNNSITNFLYKV